jgi:hypothetical protein
MDAQFPGVTQRRLPQLCSYRFLVLLDDGDFQRGIRYSKFENMWLKSEGFVDRVKTVVGLLPLSWLSKLHCGLQAQRLEC